MGERYIIYDNTPWEKQFIFQDLLNIDIKTYKNIIFTNNNLKYSNIQQWKALNNIRDIVKNNIFIFNSTGNQYDDILNLVKILKPIIIIHLSDEFGTRERFQGLSQFTTHGNIVAVFIQMTSK